MGESSGDYEGPVVTININLLGYQAREEIEKSSSGLKLSKPLLITLGLISAAIIINVIAYIVVIGLRDEQLARKEQLESRKAELERKNKEYKDKQAARDKLKLKRDILNWAVNNNFKWSSLLEELRSRIPTNLWVSKVDISSGFKMNISGETFDHKTVAKFVANLQDSPAFEDVILDFTRKQVDIKFRELNNSLVKADKTETERLVTSTTTFNIRCKVVNRN